MTSDAPIAEGQILSGPLFSEPMRVEPVARAGPSTWSVGLVGTQTQQFRRVTLSRDQIATLRILAPGPSYDGDPVRLKLGLQAYALGIAWEFDPYFGLSMSRVDPLPHQLEAIYDYLLKLALVTNCKTEPRPHMIADPARYEWHEVRKVEHYWLGVDTLTRSLRVSEPEPPPYGAPPA